MTIKNRTNFALLVHTCDRYQFLYPGFSAFFNKYWDFGIPCNYYFATENLEANLSGFQNIRSGTGQWSDRLAHLLRNDIPEKYVIYFQEDMWLNKPVNDEFFTKLFKIIETNDIKQFKLTSSDVYQTNATDFDDIEGFIIAKLNNNLSGYLMSHQVTIWHKEYLLKQLPKNEHPWRNERRGTQRLKKLNPDIYQADYFAENGYPEINVNPGPVLRSGYETVSENSALNSRVLPYIEELRKNNRIDYAFELQHHYDKQLTHDGKPKPRKEDIFKKVKNWWQKKLNT